MDWVAATFSPINALQYTVSGLMRNQGYEFRVLAVNAAGPGEPSKPSEKVETKVKTCKSDSLVEMTFL